MDYMPGASSLAATHRGKIKNIRLSTLRGDENSADPRASILHFENSALAYDKTMKKETQGTQENNSRARIFTVYNNKITRGKHAWNVTKMRFVTLLSTCHIVIVLQPLT